MEAKVLRWQVGLESIADLPLLIGWDWLRLRLGHLDSGVAGAIEPLIQLREQVRGVGRSVDGCIFQRIINEDILLVQRLRECRHFLFLDLPVPLLEDVYKKPELVVLREERVLVELLQLEGRVLLALEELSDALFDGLARVVDEDMLQGRAARDLFHIENGYSSKSNVAMED